MYKIVTDENEERLCQSETDVESAMKDLSQNSGCKRAVVFFLLPFRAKAISLRKYHRKDEVLVMD